MKWLRTIAHEVYGLFVDDGSFAIAIVVWLVVLKLLVLYTNLASHWSGFLLLAGLATILVESALRSSRRPAR